MRSTIGALVKGNRNICDYYEKACRRWKEILRETGVKDVAALRNRLRDEQSWFRTNCGGRDIGNEVMAVTAVAQFFSVKTHSWRSRKKALAVVEAFERSGCTGGVWGEVRTIAQFYGLPLRPIDHTGKQINDMIHISDLKSSRDRRALALLERYSPGSVAAIERANSVDERVSDLKELSMIMWKCQIPEKEKDFIGKWLLSFAERNRSVGKKLPKG